MSTPNRQSRLNHVLGELGATFGVYHDWKVATSFSTPETEAEVLKTGVGLADVSWLGKLEVKGREEELEALRLENGAVWNLARGHSLVTCDPEHKDAALQVVAQYISLSEGANSKSASEQSDDTARSTSVRPEPVAGQTVHGSTSSPRTEDAVDASNVEADSGDVGSVGAGSGDAGSVGAGSVGAGSGDAGSVDAGSVGAGSGNAGSGKIIETAPCLHVVDVTSAYAGLLLAGPHSREVLRRLAAPDVSDSALANRQCISAKVAGLHTRLLREDLHGVLAYTLLVGTEYAEYAWDTILHAGRQFGIMPVGSQAVHLARKGDR